MRVIKIGWALYFLLSAISFGMLKADAMLLWIVMGPSLNLALGWQSIRVAVHHANGQYGVSMDELSLAVFQLCVWLSGIFGAYWFFSSRNVTLKCVFAAYWVFIGLTVNVFTLGLRSV